LPNTNNDPDVSWDRIPAFDSSSDLWTLALKISPTGSARAKRYRSLWLDGPISVSATDRFGRPWNRFQPPFDVVVETIDADESDNDPRLRVIDGAHLAERATSMTRRGTHFAQGLGDYVIARRPGAGALKLGVPFAEIGIDDSATAESPRVEVQP